MDRFASLMDRQAEYQDRYILERWRGFADAIGADWRALYAKETCLMLMIEAMEVMHNISWKTHRSSYGAPIDEEARERMLDEIADCALFMMNLLIILESSAEELMDRIDQKIGVNVERQEVMRR